MTNLMHNGISPTPTPTPAAPPTPPAPPGWRASPAAPAVPDFSSFDPPSIANPRTPAEHLAGHYVGVRQFTHTLARPLAIEDYVVQTMPDVSPAKWHLAHTSWFFERFVLHEFVADYEPVDPRYYYLFNSYYNGAGPQHCRPRRGLISRPTVEQVYAYRQTIDRRMLDLLSAADQTTLDRIAPILTLGLNHERQHQELLVSDIKHALSSNPLLPAYHSLPSDQPSDAVALADWQWVSFDAGLHQLGHAGEDFAFDNEKPRHRVFLEPFSIASRPVCNLEMLAFIEDGGYQRPELWLSEGYAKVQAEEWTMPIYWYRDDGQWMHYTLAGPLPIDPSEPLAHVSFFEADALARWLDARLPSEAEWEVAAAGRPLVGNFAECMRFHPQPLGSPHAPHPDEPADPPLGMFGDLWEWTLSSYQPYPGFAPLGGTLGEYNGKFMCNQYVLRGGSCATSQHHIRHTYRNFFPTDARWQFAGLRLAR